MSDRKNREEKVSRAVHTNIKSVRKNEQSIRVMRRVVVLLVVLFVGIGLYISYPFWLPKLEGIFDKPFDTILNDGKREKGNFPIDPDDTITDVFAVRSYIMTADAHRLTFYDENGKKRDSYSHSFSNPVVRVNDKRALLFDSGKNDFKVFNKSGAIFSKSTDDPILTGVIGADGTAAVLTASDKFAATLLVYDKDGKQVYRYDCTNRIMSAYITPNGKSCYVCTFTSESGRIFSQVRRIDLDKNGEQMVSDDIPCLAIDCVLTDSGKLVVSGDNGLYILSKKGELVSQYEYDGELTDAVLSPQGAAAVVSGNTKGSDKMVMLGTDSDGFKEVDCESNSHDVQIYDGRAILLNSGKVSAYSFDGTLAATAELEKEYTRIVYLNSALYLNGKHGIDKIKFDM